MTLTLLALFLTPLYLMLVLDTDGAYKHFKNTAKDKTLQILHGAGMILLALLIFADHGFTFAFEWENLINWLGLIIYLKAVMFLLWEGTFKFWANWFTKKTIPAYGFFGLLVSLALIYIDTNVL